MEPPIPALEATWSSYTMRTQILTLVAASLMLVSQGAFAKIYKCTDTKGKVYYSQSYDPKLCGGGGSQLNDQGLPVKTLQRQKTPEEIAAEREKAKRDADAKVIADAQAQQDRALMMSYTSEEDLKRARDQELEVVQASANTTKMSLASQEKALAEILAHAATFERAKKPVPQVTADQLKIVRQQIETTNRQLLERQADYKRVEASFQAKFARYRELKSKVDAQRTGQ
jgi:hypothetical protein